MNSERIISWTQLTIVVAFGVLYILSPKAFSGNVNFAPVPWFLSIYFCFTILRLYLTYTRRINSVFLLLSIIVDMGINIWSYLELSYTV